MNAFAAISIGTVSAKTIKAMLRTEFDLSNASANALYLAIASNPDSGSGSLSVVASRAFKLVNIKAAPNATFTENQIRLRAYSVLYAVAKNPGAHWITKYRLALKGGASMHKYLLDNPNLPPKLLLEIYERSTAEIRDTILKHPSITGDLEVLLRTTT